MIKIRVLKSQKGSTNSPCPAELRDGIVLIAVLVFTLILTVLGISLLGMVESEVALAQSTIDRTKAFYLAEAGLEIFSAKLNSGDFGGIVETELGGGDYRVDFYPNDPNEDPYAIATGVVGGQEKRIKVTTGFLAPPYECGIYANGADGTPWTLILRGIGNAGPKSGGEVGGRDIINGNVYVNGDVAMYQQSSVNPPLGDNPFGLQGDVDATGSIGTYDSATIAGDTNEGAPLQDPPDLVGMNYAVNNTHNVSQIFAEEGVTHNSLPSDNELYDVFVINPTDRVAEYTSTTGDDYFLELHTDSPDFVGGTWKTAPTPLNVGTNRVYYIDGNLWVNSKNDTYGFNMTGKSTIVVTGDIYICDNLQYADSNSMLGMVALGKYDDSGNLVSGGNVYFGDPTYGTMYLFSSMMFAADNFLFNSRSLASFPREPESGFSLNGNISALNQVSIERDWYTKSTWNGWTYVDEARPARYNPTTGEWTDAMTGEVLTSTQINTLRHYQMKLNYDDRVRSRTTQPPGLPRGVGLIFEGFSNWEELP